MTAESKIRAWTGALLTIAPAALAACGGMTAPSQSLTGTWSGVIGAGSGGGRALRITWIAAQSGSNVTGPATLLTSPAVSAISFTGTLNGSLSGNRLSLAYTGHPEGLSGESACTVSAAGSADVDNTGISGHLDAIFTSCDGLDVQPPASDQVTLVRQ